LQQERKIAKTRAYILDYIKKLNEIENKEVCKVYVLIIDCDGPLRLQDPSSFQFTQSSKPSNNYRLLTPLSSYKQQLQQ
jgi:hypothetical protein